MADESDLSIISDIISIKGGSPSDYDGLSTEELNRLRSKAFKDAENKRSGGTVQETPESEMAAGVKAQTKKKKKKKKPNDVRFKETKPGTFTIVPFYNPNKKNKGGAVYRGRNYAYGGRVAKYKG